MPRPDGRPALLGGAARSASCWSPRAQRLATAGGASGHGRVRSSAHGDRGSSLIDNYDSFVYNLVQELGELGAEPVVFRNDAIDVAGIRAERPDAVLISPGPGRPEDGGVSLEAVRELAGEIPLLGVCLGHQCIGQAYGGTIVAAPHLMHGKTSEIHHDGPGLFAGLPDPFVATRYHSLVVDPDSVPDELEVTATSTTAWSWGSATARLRVEGVQFHPESVLTVSGPALLANFLDQLAASTPA